MRKYWKVAVFPLLILVVLGGLITTTLGLQRSAPGAPLALFVPVPTAGSVDGLLGPTGSDTAHFSAPAATGAPARDAYKSGAAAGLPGAAPEAPVTSGGAPASDIFPPPVPPDMGREQQAIAPSGLMAGQIDDNARFAEYLDYLQNYRGPMVQPIAVDQRFFLRVVDGQQQPVAGAQVQLFDGQRAVFDGRTVSDGRVLFFPAAAGASQAQQLRAVVSRGNQQAQADVTAGAAEQTVVLSGLSDNTGPVGLDLVFLLDATGSMGDEIDRIKATVDSIAVRIQQLPGSSPPRFGLVAFRDHGDAYVTRSWDFTADVAAFKANLANVQAGGGGDTPESVNAGLHDAIHLPGWASQETGRHLRMIVLVGDAAPHLDYANDYAYPALLREAVAAGIKICPIGASGLEDQGEYIFRQFAEVTQGQFVFLTYANGVSGAPGVATDHAVSNYSVNDLDSLVVNLVAGEIANQIGPDAPGKAPIGSLTGPPLAGEAGGGVSQMLAGLAGRALAALSNATTLFWLVLLAGLLVWGLRRGPARARRAGASVPFASAAAGTPPSFAPGRARFAPEHTTLLSTAPPPTVGVPAYITAPPAGHPTTPLPPLR
ncbi:MAG TPA: vWA domain-containing protein [Chloroflexia bacterium]|nr:vWA domain-containing protein [Chloroflexia bacterium]